MPHKVSISIKIEATKPAKPIKAPPIGKKVEVKSLRVSVKLSCPCCYNAKIIKSGFTKNNTQRYQCKTCNKKFVKTPRQIQQQQKKRAHSILLYMEGLGLRSIGRINGVSHVTVMNWIMQASKKQQRLMPSYSRYIEIDEIYFYTKRRKRKRWMWLAVCKESKRILSHQIGTRGKNTLKKLFHKIEPIICEHYYTDEHVSFEGVLPKEKHTASKTHTTTIEGINSAIRHYLARFRRKTKCYTKSENMLNHTMNLFIAYYNQSKQAA